MKFGQAIRDFFSALFQSKLVLQLRADLDEAKRERDYFRGQCERLQLLTQPRPQTRPQPKPDWRETPPQGATQIGQRKTWAELQAENTKKIAEEIKKMEEIGQQPIQQRSQNH